MERDEGVTRGVSLELGPSAVMRSERRTRSAGSEAYYLILDGGGLAIRDVRTETTHELTTSDVSVIGWQRAPSD